MHTVLFFYGCMWVKYLGRRSRVKMEIILKFLSIIFHPFPTSSSSMVLNIITHTSIIHLDCYTWEFSHKLLIRVSIYVGIWSVKYRQAFAKFLPNDMHKNSRLFYCSNFFFSLFLVGPSIVIPPALHVPLISS